MLYSISFLFIENNNPYRLIYLKKQLILLKIDRYVFQMSTCKKIAILRGFILSFINISFLKIFPIDKQLFEMFHRSHLIIPNNSIKSSSILFLRVLSTPTPASPREKRLIITLDRSSTPRIACQPTEQPFAAPA